MLGERVSSSQAAVARACAARLLDLSVREDSNERVYTFIPGRAMALTVTPGSFVTHLLADGYDILSVQELVRP